MLLAIQILMTVSVGMGIIMALAGIDTPPRMPDLVVGLVVVLGGWLIVMVWIWPLAAVITLTSLSILRKIGRITSEVG